jgi:hypothetical protein
MRTAEPGARSGDAQVPTAARPLGGNRPPVPLQRAVPALHSGRAVPAARNDTRRAHRRPPGGRSVRCRADRAGHAGRPLGRARRRPVRVGHGGRGLPLRAQPARDRLPVATPGGARRRVGRLLLPRDQRVLDRPLPRPQAAGVLRPPVRPDLPAVPAGGGGHGLGRGDVQPLAVPRAGQRRRVPPVPADVRRPDAGVQPGPVEPGRRGGAVRGRTAAGAVVDADPGGCRLRVGRVLRAGRAGVSPAAVPRDHPGRAGAHQRLGVAGGGSCTTGSGITPGPP